MAYTFDFETLSPFEFENLAKDILQSLFPSLHLHCYGPGPDNGIDICDDDSSPTIIGQAKHYLRSSWAELQHSLKAEKAKYLALHTTARYFIFTTFRITGSEKDIILKLFEGIIPDASHIYGPDDISSLLNEDSQIARNILFQNQKLVLTSSNVLSLIFGNLARNSAIVLKKDIEKNRTLFYPTKVFAVAKHILSENHTIIIDGQPGSGKTITSNMLLADFIQSNPDFEILYAIEKDAKVLLKNINPHAKQIIYIDDMLGQADVNLSATEENALKEIVSLTKASPTLYLILNTRTTILQTCQSRPFDLFANEISDAKITIVNADGLTRTEKAHILYNHLSYNHLPDDLLREVYETSFYWEIITSDSYSPRLIEWITSPKFVEDNQEDYLDGVRKLLTNPSIIWEDEINHCRSAEERLFLFVLYSFGFYYAPLDYVRIAFEKARENVTDIAKDKAVFDSAFGALNDSLIETITQNHKKYCNFANPQIREFVHAFLRSGEGNEKLKQLIASAVYLDQLVYLNPRFDCSEEAERMFINGEILTIPHIRENPNNWYLRIALGRSLHNSELSPKIIQSLVALGESGDLTSYSDEKNTVLELLSNPFDPYGLMPALAYGDLFAQLTVNTDDEMKVRLYISAKNGMNNEQKLAFTKRYSEDIKDACESTIVEKMNTYVMDIGGDYVDDNPDADEIDIQVNVESDLRERLGETKIKLGITKFPELQPDEEALLEGLDYSAPLEKSESKDETSNSDTPEETNEQIRILFSSLI